MTKQKGRRLPAFIVEAQKRVDREMVAHSREYGLDPNSTMFWPVKWYNAEKRLVARGYRWVARPLRRGERDSYGHRFQLKRVAKVTKKEVR